MMNRILDSIALDHDGVLVALATVLCLLASVTSVCLYYRARSSVSGIGRIWLMAAAIVAGCGIWATHVIAMLGYRPSRATAHDLGDAVLALIAAVAICEAGFWIAVRLRSDWGRLAAGIVIGGGMVGIHYLDLPPIAPPAHVTWSAALIAASIILAVGFAVAALKVASGRERAVPTLVAGVLLSIGILSHHFTGVAAMQLVPGAGRTADMITLSTGMLAYVVAGVTALVLALSLVGTIIGARFDRQSQKLNAALNNMRQGLLLFDKHGDLILFNRRYLEIYRLDPHTPPGISFRDLLQRRVEVGTFSGDADRDAVRLRNLESKTIQLPDERWIWVRKHAVEGGGWVSTHTDVTHVETAQRELKRVKTFLDTVIENVPAALFVKDTIERRYVLVNRAGERMFNCPREWLIGKQATDFFPPNQAKAITEHDDMVLKLGREIFVGDIRRSTPEQGISILSSTRTPIRDDAGQIKYILSVIEDVTARRIAEARVEHMARHDLLTDLPNRASFNERLGASLDEAKAHGSLAVLSMNLDRFKEVNDLFGHASGDALLKETAARLQAAVGEDAFLARLGSDEFAVILTDGEQPKAAAALADRLVGAVADGFEIDGHQLPIEFGIGIAIYPSDGTDAITLVGNANAALDRAKSRGAGTICFFAPEMDKRLRERRALQQDLQPAVMRDEFVLHYQPQASIDGTIVGFEALVRWNHRVRGMMLPQSFIPLAEENGTILPLGEWILRAACREAASWPRQLQIAVNLSPVQFRHGDLPGLVQKVLHETGLDPERLELEITEGVLIGDLLHAMSILRRLKAVGVRIAMDDFGTGYSSLSYLQSFPFDKIKIDRAFVANIATKPQAVAIIRAVIGLGHGLDLPVIAEGVETHEQLAFLAREKCNEVQGFLIGRPLPVEHYASAVGRASPRKNAQDGTEQHGTEQSARSQTVPA